MGKNTPKRQEFIMENLRFEEDVMEINKITTPNITSLKNGRTGWLFNRKYQAGATTRHRNLPESKD